jgi:hypothetical protein
MRESVEETKDLLAFHNISAPLLVDALDRDGLLMPSLAITNKGMTDFGEISLVFDKNTIDPNANSDNKLYGADAWTPTQTQLKKNAKFDTNKTVNAVNNALKGNNSVTVKGDAEVLIEGADDAIKADSLDEGKGYVTVTENAKVTIYCEDDGLQATQNITITTGATVTTYAKGNSVNCDGILTIDEGCLIENAVEGATEAAE